MLLAELDDKSMELVVMPDTQCCVVFSKRVESQLLDLEIAGFSMNKLMARGKPAQIFIGYHDRVPKRIEQDRIGSFRANTGKRQQLFT